MKAKYVVENLEKIKVLRQQCYVCAFTPKLELGACMACSHMKQMLKRVGE